MPARTRRIISIPPYTVGEEISNAVSHGFGALLSAAALVLLLVRACGALAVTAAALYGSAMILLYTMSCLYHALPPSLTGKKVLRILDHCSVFLLVFGTYIPAALLGVGGARGWTLFGLVAFFSLLGIVLTALDLEHYQTAAVFCQLLSGWSILIGIRELLAAMGTQGMAWMIAGGLMYTVGAALYGLGKSKRYCHCVFHVFCLLGSFCHFWAIYQFLL